MSNSQEQLQYLFNTSVKGVIDQGTKSVKESDPYSCVYRGPNNLKCAVGHLISDTYYDAGFESLGIADNDEIQDAVSESVGFELEDNAINLLTDLQDYHDNTPLTNFVEEFKDQASLIARHLNLEWKF